MLSRGVGADSEWLRNVLPMQATVGSCLRDGDAVMVLVRPNAFMLQQAVSSMMYDSGF